MDWQSVDWVALMGILGTIAGVVVGSWTTYKIQERQLRHSDETRFQAERLDVYSRYLGATNRAITTWAVGGVDNELVNEVIRCFELLRLIGNKGTVNEAKTASSKNSRQIVCQNRSILPRVIGWWGADLTCWMPCCFRVFWNCVLPFQATNWRPLSLRISRGAPH